MHQPRMRECILKHGAKPLVVFRELYEDDHVGFVVDTVTLEQALLRDLKFCPVTIAAPVLHIQGPPKKCIHTLTKENSMLYNRLL